MIELAAIAEVIEPQLSSQYYVEVETRTDQTDENEEELLIGIPDAIVFSSPLDRPSLERPILESAAAAT